MQLFTVLFIFFTFPSVQGLISLLYNAQVYLSINKIVDAEIAAATDLHPEFISIKETWALHFLGVAYSNHI